MKKWASLPMWSQVSSGILTVHVGSAHIARLLASGESPPFACRIGRWLVGLVAGLLTTAAVYPSSVLFFQARIRQRRKTCREAKGVCRLWQKLLPRPLPATASAEGAQLNGRPFPATASAEGAPV